MSSWAAQQFWKWSGKFETVYSLKQSFSVLRMHHNYQATPRKGCGLDSSHYVWGGALSCNEKVLWHCAWLENVVRDQPDLLRRPWSCSYTHFASRVRATTPERRGAAALVPVKESEHCPLRDVVCCRKLSSYTSMLSWDGSIQVFAYSGTLS